MLVLIIMTVPIVLLMDIKSRRDSFMMPMYNCKSRWGKSSKVVIKVVDGRIWKCEMYRASRYLVFTKIGNTTEWKQKFISFAVKVVLALLIWNRKVKVSDSSWETALSFFIISLGCDSWKEWMHTFFNKIPLKRLAMRKI